MKYFASFFSFFCLGLLCSGQACASAQSSLSKAGQCQLDKAALQTCLTEISQSAQSNEAALAIEIGSEPRHFATLDLPSQFNYPTFSSVRNFEIRAGLSPPESFKI